MVGGDAKKIGKGQTTQSLLCHGEDSEFCSESEGNYWEILSKRIALSDLHFKKIFPLLQCRTYRLWVTRASYIC